MNPPRPCDSDFSAPESASNTFISSINDRRQQLCTLANAYKQCLDDIQSGEEGASNANCDVQQTEFVKVRDEIANMLDVEVSRVNSQLREITQRLNGNTANDDVANFFERSATRMSEEEIAELDNYKNTLQAMMEDMNKSRSDNMIYYYGILSVALLSAFIAYKIRG